MGARRRYARPSATIAACGALAALLVYVGKVRGAGEPATEHRAHVQRIAAPGATDPQPTTSFATIGIGACRDAEVKSAQPAVTTAASGSCDAPVGHDLDLASLSLVETRASRGASYLP